MPVDARLPTAGAWTIMLADIVALLLAFFVLSFSMRELVPTKPSPTLQQPEAVAALEALSSNQHTALEQERASSPSFAYLAAIIEANSRDRLADDAIWHDDTRLVVRLPGEVEGSGDAADAGSRELLLALAFLARRFDLDLALDLPGSPEHEIERNLERTLAIRAWLGETTGLRLNETTFAAAAAGGGTADGRLPAAYAALNARPAQVPATAAIEP
jgi:flagellar motor protein MotB